MGHAKHTTFEPLCIFQYLELRKHDVSNIRVVIYENVSQVIVKLNNS